MTFHDCTPANHWRNTALTIKYNSNSSTAFPSLFSGYEHFWIIMFYSAGVVSAFFFIIIIIIKSCAKWFLLLYSTELAHQPGTSYRTTLRGTASACTQPHRSYRNHQDYSWKSEHHNRRFRGSFSQLCSYQKHQNIYCQVSYKITPETSSLFF